MLHSWMLNLGGQILETWNLRRSSCLDVQFGSVNIPRIFVTCAFGKICTLSIILKPSRHVLCVMVSQCLQILESYYNINSEILKVFRWTDPSKVKLISSEPMLTSSWILSGWEDGAISANQARAISSPAFKIGRWTRGRRFRTWNCTCSHKETSWRLPRRGEGFVGTPPICGS